MIVGAHLVIYSVDPDRDREFFDRVLKLPNVDAGDGWLIFGLPPAEAAVHPDTSNGRHELYLMCEDVSAFVSWMNDEAVPCSPIHDEPWGRVVHITLPGGGGLGVYQPLHERLAESPKTVA